MPDNRLDKYFQEQQDAMVSMLQQLVDMDSPTDTPHLVNRVGEFIAEELRSQQATVARDEQTERGDHILADFGDSDREPVLLIGHMDTVWPAGTAAERPFALHDSIATGPGVQDMKAGLVVMLFAVRAARELGLSYPRPLRLLFNSDEEQRSEFSRDLIMREAQRSAYALVFEGTPEVNEVTTSRKASGRFTVAAIGKASHAGAAIDEGINAIEELAWQIPILQRMTNLEIGTTVSVGVIQGGSRPNVVPAYAEMQLSVRAATTSEMERIDAEIRGLQPVLPGASLKISGDFHRGPYEPNEGNQALFSRLQAAALPLGLDLQGRQAGGASDANLTSSVGTPTLDGLGAVGSGAHSLDEHIQVQSLAVRANLLTRLLLSLD